LGVELSAKQFSISVIYMESMSISLV